MYLMLCRSVTDTSTPERLTPTIGLLLQSNLPPASHQKQ
jgi:hypothetical protein